MYVEQIPNRNSKPTWLIRESKWIDGKSVKFTVTNLTRLPQAIIDGIGILLKGGTAVNSIKDPLRFEVANPTGMLPQSWA